MTKHEEREYFFKLVFMLDFYDRSDFEEQTDLFRRLQMASEQEKFAVIKEKAYKLVEVQGEIDTVLAKASVGWPLSRLGKSELSIMRVAAYEILYDEEVPAKVAINEAVELAKTYGNDSAPSFINGVLAKLVTEGE